MRCGAKNKHAKNVQLKSGSREKFYKSPCMNDLVRAKYGDRYPLCIKSRRAPGKCDPTAKELQDYYGASFGWTYSMYY
jgi:hypothetical protein